MLKICETPTQPNKPQTLAYLALVVGNNTVGLCETPTQPNKPQTLAYLSLVVGNNAVGL